jgi:hypothetical protein
MEILGTKEAFKHLISHRGIYKVLGVDKSTVSTWKQYLFEGNSISIDKMEDVLQRAGATIKQDKIWNIPMADVFRGDMLDFHEELSKIEIGQSITIDTRIHSEVIVQNAISRKAMKINSQVSRSDFNRPIITYKFEIKP